VGFAAAAASIAAALLIRWLLDPLLGDSHALSLLFGGIALAVWFGGLWIAVLAAAGGYLASNYLFIAPRGVVAIADFQAWTGLTAYVISCAAIIGFGSGLRNSQLALQRKARDLEQETAKLQRVEARKDRFLATLAHELRNPLAPLLLSTQALRRRAQGRRDLQDVCSMIERQTRHIARLVDDLLDVSRIGSGHIRLELETIDLGSVIGNAIEMARGEIENRSQKLGVSLALDRVLLKGDFTRLTQVFVNLLVNAARHTPSGGRLSIQAFCAGAYAVVSIRDSGIGIPAEMQEHIFDLYAQPDSRGGSDRRGLGVGLWLVRRLLELHGATIEVHSDGPAAGSEFIVRMPVPMAVPLDAPLRRA
jgi:signal transduction histidine kinase